MIKTEELIEEKICIKQRNQKRVCQLLQSHAILTALEPAKMFLFPYRANWINGYVIVTLFGGGFGESVISRIQACDSFKSG